MPIPGPTVPVYKGPPCPTCKVPTQVDFQLPNCVNASCGKYDPCQCVAARGLAPEPYNTTLTLGWTWNGAPAQRDATFCRRCGDELKAKTS